MDNKPNTQLFEALEAMLGWIGPPPVDQYSFEELNAKLLEAVKATMDWHGPPPVDRYSYDYTRERAWEMGRAAIEAAEV